MRHAYAAVQHLQHGRSTVDLAEELHVSRFMIGRMIQRAKADGLVEVVSRLPGAIDTALSEELAIRYGLKSAFVVVPQSDHASRVRDTLARTGARVFADLVTEDDAVGIGPGRTILEMSAHLTDIPSCDIVQLTGAATMTAEDSQQAIATISRFAEGRLFSLHAPFFITDARAAAAISAQPLIRQTLQRMDHLDVAVLSVGGWPRASLLADMVAHSGELDDVLAQGAIAEIGTTLLAQDGGEVTAIADRLVGISTMQLRRVPLKIAIGGGPGKQRAVVAVLRSGLVDVLITDARCARFALDARSDGESPRPS